MALPVRLHVARNGSVLGDYSVQEVRSYLDSGFILTTDFIWSDGWTDWKPLQDVFSSLEAVSNERRMFEPEWRTEPATEKQISYLKTFGIVAPPDLTKGEASDVIDRATRDPKALEHQSKVRAAEFEAARADEAKFPSFYLRKQIVLAEAELAQCVKDKAEARTTVGAKTKELRAAGKRLKSVQEELERDAIAKELEYIEFDIEQAQETIERSPSDLEDAREELKRLTRLRTQFWKSTFSKLGAISINSDDLIDYCDAIDDLHRTFGRALKTPTSKQIGDVLTALDQAYLDWDKTRPQAFYATVAASFPSLHR